MRVARRYGRLRRVTPEQADVVRRAAEYDRSVLPRWQRGGDGFHIVADPGAYAGLLSWRSREHWLDVVVPAAIAARPEVLRDTVAPAMFALYARTLSLYALSNGRRCIVRPDRLAELMGVSEPTVHRCRRAAVRLELIALVFQGDMLNATQTWTCRQQGSRQRGLSNEYGLVVPSWLPHSAAWTSNRRAGIAGEATRAPGSVLPLWRTPQSTPNPKHSLTPLPEVSTEGRYSSPSTVPSGTRCAQTARSARGTEPPPAALSREDEQRDPPSADGRRRRGAAPQPPQAPTEAVAGPAVASPVVRGPGRGSERPSAPPESGAASGSRGAQPRRSTDPAAMALARALIDALPWLAGTPAGRLERTLRRFATRPSGLDWTAGDVIDAIEAMNRRLGRASMTRTLVRNPWGLLASYLRDLDPDADHPLAGVDLDDAAIRTRIAARPVERATGRTAAIRRRNAQLLAERRDRSPRTAASVALAGEARSAVRESHAAWHDEHDRS